MKDAQAVGSGAVRRRLQEGAVAVGIWAVFAILSIWVPPEALIVAVGVAAFGAGVALGLRGIGVSALSIVALSLLSELSSDHPLSVHTLLTSGSLALCLVLVCGFAGHLSRAVVRRLAGEKAGHSLP